MAKRLVKVAKELNVGTSTIVDHLRSKGFEIENKPIAKITDEMEVELRKEFAKAIAIKEQADSLIIGTRPSPKKEESSPQPPPPAPVVEATPPPPPPPKPEPQPEPEPVVVEAPKVEEKPAPKQETAKVEEVVEPSKPKVQLKIKGKIDLDKKARPKKEVKPKKEEVKEPVVEVEDKKVEKEKEEVKVEAKQEVVKEEVKDTPKHEAVEEKPKKEEEKKPVEAKKEEVVEKVEKTPAPPAKTKKEEEVKGEVAPSEGGQDDKENAGVPEKKVIKAEAPELRGLKILGKINIEKPKPKKKKKEVKKREDNRPRTQGSPEDRRRRPGDARPDNRNQQSGEKKQGEGSSDPNRPRRPRKRRRVSRASTVGGNNAQRGGQRRPQGRGPGGPGRRRQDEVKEVSQKQIDDQIKATMARMSGGGKKKRQRLARDKRERMREKQEQLEAAQETGKLQVTEFVTVQELANLMDVGVTDVITACMGVGVIVSINQRLDAEIIELVASEFEHEVEFISAEEQVDEEEEIVDAPEDLSPRAPIVTVMGHVDHGKTSLLDYIREANVAEGEAGGITQHIGAYEVKVGEEEKQITFLDTPGHEAFTAMRARGAKVTDISIIIIAADDNIMPQTREAISHSQAAGVPMVFAINKVDKPGANPERIKQELASMNLLVEEWGGEYQSQDISAKTGQGIEALLEKVLLVAELLELQANPDRASIGAILEASLDKGRGYVAKALVQTGTLHIGDAIVAGEYSGKIKAMFNERGKRIKEAGPSTPVLILGLSGAPTAGERFKEMTSESEARQLAARRSQIAREQANRATKRISLDEIGRRLALGNFKELNLIVKGDVDGSIEALSDSLIKLSIETVQVNVIHKAVGQIIESDVLLASASDAIIIGFQVRPSVNARKLAEREGVQIKGYSIIYEAIEEIKLAIEGMLEPTKEEKIVANVEVRETFKISKVGTIAGCYVLDGKISRNSNIRVIRNGIVIYPTKEGVTAELASLKRFKDDVKEVKNGMECGMNVKNFNDIKVGDIIEAYEIVEIKQTLS